MRGLRRTIVAVAAALFASAAGTPLPAAADSPVDPAAAVQTVAQHAEVSRAAAAAPAVHETISLQHRVADTPSAAAIRETVERAANRAPGARGPSGDPGRPAVPTRPAGRPAAAPERPVASVPSPHDRRSAPAVARRATTASSPPHGWKAAPPARSAPERAVGSRSASGPVNAVPVPDGVPGGTGTTLGAGSLVAPSAIFFVALLIGALAALRLLDLHPLRIRAPAWRRLAFVTPAVPPG